jgi:hypothetical protein
MNSAQLYLELFQSGERVLQALANERDLDVLRPGDLSYRKWEEYLSLARQQVECAAERYAIALRKYLLAMMSELDPADAIPTRPVGAITKRRERTQAAGAGRNARMHCRKPRKDVTAEVFPISTRMAQVQ